MTEGNNLSASRPSPTHDVELPSDRRASGDGADERAGPQTATNDKAIEPVGDVNQPFDDFDFGHFFNKYRCVQTGHNPLPTSSTEQLGTVALAAFPRNELTGVIDRLIAKFRRTDGTFSSFGFRNDNDNAGWHPLDCA